MHGGSCVQQLSNMLIELHYPTSLYCTFGILTSVTPTQAAKPICVRVCVCLYVWCAEKCALTLQQSYTINTVTYLLTYLR